MKQLRKQAVYDQLKLLAELMSDKPEWSSVNRHVLRALVATSEILKRK